MGAEMNAKYVNLTVPSILFGGNSKGLLDWMKMRGHPVMGRAGTWRVCTEENYLSLSRPGLLTYRHLAGPGVESRIVRVLSTPVGGATFNAGQDSIERVNAIGDRLEGSSEIADMFVHMKLAVMVASETQLPDVLNQIFDAMREIPFKGEPARRPLSNASVHLAARDPAITHRIKFPSVSLRFEYDDRLAKGELPIVGDMTADPGFSAALDLHSGMMMLDPYFGPLAGCLSPYVWCFVVPRNHGVVVLDLGTTLSGTRSQVGELLQTLPNYGPETGVARPRFPATAFADAVEWWTERLDALFGILSDPAVFRDLLGDYRAVAHLHALLTIEQLFRRVISIQGGARDTHATRVLLFSVLDTLQRLTGRPIEMHCSADFAKKTLTRLRTSLPTGAQDVLLWGPERAVSGLAEVQDGFFLRSLTGDRVVIREDGGHEREFSLDAAAAHYLKVLRDATHGHGSNRDNAKGKTNALLAQHDGRVPHEVAGLGFLYMLDILANPEVLRRILANHST